MTPTIPGQPRWWQWPTILSLDAPLVCLLWQALLARVAHSQLRWSHVVVLGASVWLAYAADRWIEAWRLDRRFVQTERHHFYQRHQGSVAFAWVVVFCADLVVAVATLDARELRWGALLMLPVLTYLLSHQFVHRTRRFRVPKEIIVASLLTGGVGVFLWPSPRPRELMFGLGIFATVSFVNCALISSWERDVDRAHGQTSLALGAPGIARAIAWLPWAAAVAVAALLVVAAPSPATPALCGIGSALLLGVVDRAERGLGWAAARVLADAALLTPLTLLRW